jgi:hypothetical protein
MDVYVSLPGTSVYGRPSHNINVDTGYQRYFHWVDDDGTGGLGIHQEYCTNQ